MNKIYGYARTKGTDDDIRGQERDLLAYGVPNENIVKETAETAKGITPLFEEMIEGLTKGDTLVVCSISRITRNPQSFVETVNRLMTAGVRIVSIHEDLDTENEAAKQAIQISAAILGDEAEYRTKRSKDAIESAIQKGKHIGRPAGSISQKTRDAIDLVTKSGYSVKNACEKTGVNPNTVYRAMRNKENAKK